jgi:ABC-2 type transport system ATP-binding protein
MEILEKLGLEETRFSDPLEEMSRGMQQQTFLEELWREEGTTILLTSHDMAETERLCSRIGFLAHGRLTAEGTATELKEQTHTSSLDDAFIAFAGEAIGNKENRETQEE